MRHWKIAQDELPVHEEHALIPERHRLADAIIRGESATAFGNKNRRQCGRRNHKRNAHRLRSSLVYWLFVNTDSYTNR